MTEMGMLGPYVSEEANAVARLIDAQLRDDLHALRADNARLRGLLRALVDAWGDHVRSDWDVMMTERIDAARKELEGAEWLEELGQ
jgi:hypothetical protein